MAKGQMRSNREAKKPKKPKSEATTAATSGGPWPTADKTPAKTSPGRKK